MEIMSGKSRTAGGLGSEWFSFYWLSVLVKHCSASRTHSHQVGAGEWSSRGKRRAVRTSSACFQRWNNHRVNPENAVSLWICQVCLLPCWHDVRSLISANGGAVKQALIWLHKLSIKPKGSRKPILWAHNNFPSAPLISSVKLNWPT